MFVFFFQANQKKKYEENFCIFFSRTSKKITKRSVRVGSRKCLYFFFRPLEKKYEENRVTKFLYFCFPDQYKNYKEKRSRKYLYFLLRTSGKKYEEYSLRKFSYFFFPDQRKKKEELSKSKLCQTLRSKKQLILPNQRLPNGKKRRHKHMKKANYRA